MNDAKNKAISEKEKQVGIMLTEDLIKEIQVEADKKERSLSGQIRFVLKQWLDEGRKL